MSSQCLLACITGHELTDVWFRKKVENSTYEALDVMVEFFGRSDEEYNESEANLQTSR